MITIVVIIFVHFFRHFFKKKAIRKIVYLRTNFHVVIYFNVIKSLVEIRFDAQYVAGSNRKSG